MYSFMSFVDLNMLIMKHIVNGKIILNYLHKNNGLNTNLTKTFNFLIYKSVIKIFVHNKLPLIQNTWKCMEYTQCNSLDVVHYLSIIKIL